MSEQHPRPGAAAREDRDCSAADSMIANHLPNFILLFQSGGALGFKSKENIFLSQQFNDQEGKIIQHRFLCPKMEKWEFPASLPQTGGDGARVLLEPWALAWGFLGTCPAGKHCDPTTPAKVLQSTCQPRRTFSPLAKAGVTVPVPIPTHI